MPTVATIRMKIVAPRSSERVRMCGVMGAPRRVVPPHGGTHNLGRQWVKEASDICPKRDDPAYGSSLSRGGRVESTVESQRRWLWAPACAGTTESVGRSSRFHRA